VLQGAERIRHRSHGLHPPPPLQAASGVARLRVWSSHRSHWDAASCHPGWGEESRSQEMRPLPRPIPQRSQCLITWLHGRAAWSVEENSPVAVVQEQCQ